MFKDSKKRIYRQIKYALTRPKPPSPPNAFDGPVVVVGSAPTSNLPKGFSDSFRTISVNGSQRVMEQWGIQSPDLTFFGFNEIRGTNLSAVESRRVLKGRNTGMLYVFLWRDGLTELEEGLRGFDYTYDKLQLIDRYQRMALIRRVCGLKNFEADTEDKCSNGINAVLFALYHRAPAVIMTGINPFSKGHAYNSENLERLHQSMDSRVLETLLAKRLPIFTADPDVNQSTGVPLWTGC